jgi:signal peptidase I
MNLKKLWKENRSLIIFLLLMFVFRGVVADWNEVPTGSMKPTGFW